MLHLINLNSLVHFSALYTQTLQSQLRWTGLEQQLGGILLMSESCSR